MKNIYNVIGIRVNINKKNSNIFTKNENIQLLSKNWQ